MVPHTDGGHVHTEQVYRSTYLTKGRNKGCKEEDDGVRNNKIFSSFLGVGTSISIYVEQLFLYYIRLEVWCMKIHAKMSLPSPGFSTGWSHLFCSGLEPPFCLPILSKDLEQLGQCGMPALSPWGKPFNFYMI